MPQPSAGWQSLSAIDAPYLNPTRKQNLLSIKAFPFFQFPVRGDIFYPIFPVPGNFLLCNLRISQEELAGKGFFLLPVILFPLLGVVQVADDSVAVHNLNIFAQHIFVFLSLRSLKIRYLIVARRGGAMHFQRRKKQVLP